MNARSLLNFALTATTLLAIAPGCGFDGEQLQDRRCENDSACHARFGEGYSCLAAKYCAKVTFVCRDDEDCSDGVFCNGPETCDPGNEAAGEDGCVLADAAAFVADDAACTTDYCDEQFDRLIHDPSGCGCANDSQCRELNTDPCESAVCGPDRTCVTSIVAAGEPCDDGIGCTVGTLCNDAGQCIYDDSPEAAAPSSQDDSLCDDGMFCNGVESCDYLNPAADPLTGCILGTPPTEDADDGIECTVAFCNEDAVADEDKVVHDPSNCECQAAEDCQAGSCNVYFCSVTTNYRCVQDPGGAFLPAGSPCSDGFECTANVGFGRPGLGMRLPVRNSRW
jgi:hypothetical protein